MSTEKKQRTVSLGVLDGENPDHWPPWRVNTLGTLVGELPTRRANFLTADEFEYFHVVVQPELVPLRALFDSPSIAAVIGVFVDPVGHDARAIANHQQAVMSDFRSFCRKLRQQTEPAYRIFGFSIFMLADSTRFKDCKASIVELKRSLDEAAYFWLWEDSKAGCCRSVILNAEVALAIEIETYIESVHEILILNRATRAG